MVHPKDVAGFEEHIKARKCSEPDCAGNVTSGRALMEGKCPGDDDTHEHCKVCKTIISVPTVGWCPFCGLFTCANCSDTMMYFENCEECSVQITGTHLCSKCFLANDLRCDHRREYSHESVQASFQAFLKTPILRGQIILSNSDNTGQISIQVLEPLDKPVALVRYIDTCRPPVTNGGVPRIGDKHEQHFLGPQAMATVCYEVSLEIEAFLQSGFSIADSNNGRGYLEGIEFDVPPNEPGPMKRRRVAERRARHYHLRPRNKHS